MKCLLGRCAPVKGCEKACAGGVSGAGKVCAGEESEGKVCAGEA